MDGSPFKEAWAHDFAPPIHSLDRHGDFAPPLLALGLAAGFFGVATVDDVDESGWRFNLANGDDIDDHGSGWGYVQFASFVDVTTVGDAGSFGLTGEYGLVLFDETGAGILLASNGPDFQVALTNGFFVTVHGGDFTVDTLSDEFGDGTVQIDAGDINIVSHHDGNVVVTSDALLTLNSDDDLTLDAIHGGVVIEAANDVEVDLANGKHFIVKDHLGSPLVTYTG